eukprot:s2342_g1.t1
MRPSEEELQDLMAGQQRITKAVIARVVFARLHRVVPHSLRGMALGQLQHLEEVFVKSGWLAGQCASCPVTAAGYSLLFDQHVTLGSTLLALRLWAAKGFRNFAQHPDSVVFWICLFALNQHAVAEEVGQKPMQGPFNAALAQAAGGAVMAADDDGATALMLAAQGGHEPVVKLLLEHGAGVTAATNN